MGRGSQRLCNQNVIYLGFNKKAVDFPWVINKMSCGEFPQGYCFLVFLQTQTMQMRQSVSSTHPPPPTSSPTVQIFSVWGIASQLIVHFIHICYTHLISDIPFLKSAILTCGMKRSCSRKSRKACRSTITRST